MKKETVYDLLIVGAGPAGLSAAVYAARYKLNALVFGNLIGGMAAEAHKICNFPTYSEITGFEFAQKMRKQVEGFGIKIVVEEVAEISKKKVFEVKTSKNKTYLAKKIVLATGTERKKLGLKNENKFLGRGVSYCTTCDAPLFKDRVVGVVGGSNTALTSALLLSEFAKKVYLIYRQGKFFRAEKVWIELVEKNKKIEPVFNSDVAELIGESKLEAVKLTSGKEIKLNGLFVNIGSIPNSGLAKNMGLELKEGYIKTDREQRTNIKGVFAAGDVTDYPLKQIVTAAAQGAVAATNAYHEIESELK